MAKKQREITDYITPLSINGLNGRMLHLPAPAKKKRNILLVYGHHASLERMLGFAEFFNKYGSLTMPDLPGLGGMDSFYKIGKRPTFDNMADYLAAFIKLRFKNKKVTIIALSFGFPIVTRMLQKYPKLVNNVDVLVSAAGFTHHDDFNFSRRQRKIGGFAASVLSARAPSFLIRALLVHRPVIDLAYKLSGNHKMQSGEETEATRKERIDFETTLWKVNDMRTHMFTIAQMMRVDVCKEKVNLPVYHLGVDTDQYLNNHMIEQHMRVVYSDFRLLPLKDSKSHSVTVIASAKEAGQFVPPKLRSILSKQ